MANIRHASESDYEEICGLIRSKDELYLIYPSGSYPFTVSQLVEIAEVRKELTVCVENNRVVGFANLYGYVKDQYAYIGNLVIDTEFRGMGLGKSLISHLVRTAFEKYNLPELRISVFNSNTAALLMYYRFGFSPYDMEEREGLCGEKTALIHMKLAFLLYQSTCNK